MSLLRHSIRVGIAFAALSCGGGGGGGGDNNGYPTTPPPAQTTLGSITVTPPSLTLAAGNTQTLAVQAFDTQSRTLSVTGWQFTSASSAIATVNAGGTVTGISAGSTQLTVALTYNSVSKSASVSVTVTGQQGPLGSIVTAPAAIQLVAGASTVITAQAMDTQGRPMTVTGFSFASSNTAVATVGNDGVVTGVAVGSAQVTVSLTYAGVSKSATVNVGVVPGSLPTSANVAADTYYQFAPSTVTIGAGGTVTWDFGSTQHSVQFNGNSTGTPQNIPNSANTSVTRTFTTAGTFNYDCGIHYGMSGTVVVK